MIDNKVICLYPWVHLQVSPDNKSLPCCKFNDGGGSSLVNFDHNFNIEKQWLHLRRKMLEGKEIRECRHCYSIEKADKESMRTQINNDFNLEDLNLTEDYYGLLSLEIGLDNICNFECRMCSSRFSSKLAKRDDLFSNILGLHEKRVIDKDKIDIIKSWNIDWSKLQHVKILGGEPFFSPRFETLIDLLLERCNYSNLTISLNTNCSVQLSNNLIDKMNKFKHIKLCGSFDGIKEFNNYQRVNSNFESNLNNFKLYTKQLHNSSSYINSVYTNLILNNFSVADKFWSENLPNTYVVIDVVRYSPFSPLIMPDWYNDWIDSKLNFTTERGKVLQSILTQKRQYNKMYYSKLLEFIESYDIYHNTSLEDVNPELYYLLRKNDAV